MARRGMVILAAWLAAGLAALAPWPSARAEQNWAGWPAPCVSQIAREAQLSKSLLQAIAWVESRGHPWALNVNAQGRSATIYPSSLAEARRRLEDLLRQRASVDIGVAQINSRHLRRLKLQAHWLLDPCVNLRASAEILNELIGLHGESWRAIMRYNGRNPAYAHRVKAAWDAFRRLDIEGQP